MSSKRARATAAYLTLLVLTMACGVAAPDEPPPPPEPVAVAPVAPPAPVAPAAPAAPAPTLTFDGDTYRLASDEGGADVPLREYILPTETFDTFTRMVALRHRPNEPDPMAFATRFAAVTRTQTPGAAPEITSDAQGRVFLTFIAQAGPVTELNVFRYERDPSGAGLRSYQVVRRAYQNPAASRVAFEADRSRLLRVVASHAFPAPG